MPTVKHTITITGPDFTLVIREASLARAQIAVAYMTKHGLVFTTQGSQGRANRYRPGEFTLTIEPPLPTKQEAPRA